MKTNEQKVLLAVLAHPDDETFGMGGSLAYYASIGVKVYLVCATRGEAGDVPPELMHGYGSVAELREQELCCAAKHLGLSGVFFLGFRDSGMTGSPDNHHPNALAATSMETVALEIIRYIRLLKSQVIITFDPIGGYMHPDHIAVHRATEKAFHLAADPTIDFPDLPPFRPQKLYYHTFPRGFLRLVVWMMRLTGKDPHKFGRNGDIDLVPVAEARFPVNARVDYRLVLEKKDNATECHASQGGSRITTGVIGLFRKLFGISDQYMRAYPPPERRSERDLFEGVLIEETTTPAT